MQLGRSDQLRAATWLVRASRDRARIYETLVRGIVELRPDIAVVHEPNRVAPLLLADLVARTKLDIEVVRRSAGALRFQTPAVTIAGVLQDGQLSFHRARVPRTMRGATCGISLLFPSSAPRTLVRTLEHDDPLATVRRSLRDHA